jgi:hypothetical protein
MSTQLHHPDANVTLTSRDSISQRLRSPPEGRRTLGCMCVDMFRTAPA